MQYSSTMTSKGQVTIPVAIRRRLGLKPGETVRFTLTKNHVEVEKNDWREALRRLQAENQAYLKRHHIRPLSNEELDDAINAAAEAAVTEDYRRSLEP